MSEYKEINDGIKAIYERVGEINRVTLLQQLKGKSFGLLSSSEMDCIEYIGSHKNANVTKLAKSTSMTTSAISKVIKRLEKRSIVERYQESDNLKEVYCRLTAQGVEIYEFHKEMTKQFLERDNAVYQEMSNEEISIILRFIDSYTKHLNEITLNESEDII